MAQPMTPEEFAERMRKLAASDDQEGSHVDADQLMCRVLRSLGYTAGVKTFRQMPKWYAYQAKDEAYALDWTRHGRVAAGGLEQRRTTTTVKVDDAGKVVSRTTVEQVEQTLPHEGALRWRLAVVHGLHQRVEVSGPDGGPIPVEATAAALVQRLAAFVDATATEVDAPDESWGPGVASLMAELPSPDADVPPPAD